MILCMVFRSNSQKSYSWVKWKETIKNFWRNSLGNSWRFFRKSMDKFLQKSPKYSLKELSEDFLIEILEKLMKESLEYFKKYFEILLKQTFKRKSWENILNMFSKNPWRISEGTIGEKFEKASGIICEEIRWRFYETI